MEIGKLVADPATRPWSARQCHCLLLDFAKVQTAVRGNNRMSDSIESYLCDTMQEFDQKYDTELHIQFTALDKESSVAMLSKILVRFGFKSARHYVDTLFFLS